MNLVVISDDDNVLNYAPDAIELNIFEESEPEIYVSLDGIPGPRGLQGPKGEKGDTGSIGDVTALPPLYYSPTTNTIYLDASVFEVAGAATAALNAAKAYADNIAQTIAKKYVHTQNSASASWVVIHNLNTKPEVTIVDSANRRVFGDIIYDDLNSLHVNFTAPFSGTAYLI